MPVDKFLTDVRTRYVALQENHETSNGPSFYCTLTVKGLYGCSVRGYSFADASISSTLLIFVCSGVTLSQCVRDSVDEPPCVTSDATSSIGWYIDVKATVGWSFAFSFPRQAVSWTHWRKLDSTADSSVVWVCTYWRLGRL